MRRLSAGGAVLSALLAVLVALGCLLAGSRLLPGTDAAARASATVVVVPRVGNTIGSDILGLTTASYAAYLSAPATLAQVAATEGLAPADVQRTTVTVPPSTVTIVVTGRAADGTTAAATANAVASAALLRSASDNLVTVQLVAPAVASSPTAASRRALLGALALVAALVGLGVGVVAGRALSR